MTPARPVIALTPGEPAGIGPDLAVTIAGHDFQHCLVAVADPALLERRAALRGLAVRLVDYNGAAHRKGVLQVIPVTLAAPEQCGVPDPANAGYVLETLARAVDGCLAAEFGALVTGPVQKSALHREERPFTGHTEYLAERCGAPWPVMMLAGERMRVALATTHVPLAQAPALITRERLCRIVEVLDHDLRRRFGIAQPRITVCGLNPHAGESGTLGTEERDHIAPAVAALAAQGIAVSGPLPADTAFTRARLDDSDVVLAMYHDQGLPVIKHADFGEIVNITLGLPIVRTSVDHGTALDRAGAKPIDSGSLLRAINMASRLAAAQ